jgi:hypothetical protein
MKIGPRSRLKAAAMAATTLCCMTNATVPSLAADLAELPTPSSGWTFTFAPYLWGAGINGDIGLFDLEPQEIDASFSDILDHFDVGAMAVAEARNGPFLLGADINYVNLSTNVDTPHGILADSIDVEATSFMFTGFAGYSVIYDENLNLDFIAGARVWHSKTEFNFNSPAPILEKFDGADDGNTWVDPLVGVKGRAEIGSGFYVSGWGMVGGFGVSSDFMWDVLGAIGYEFSDSFSLVAGYRAMGVDYENDGFVYDVVQKGPIVGAVFRF